MGQAAEQVLGVGIVQGLFQGKIVALGPPGDRQAEERLAHPGRGLDDGVAPFGGDVEEEVLEELIGVAAVVSEGAHGDPGPLRQRVAPGSLHLG